MSAKTKIDSISPLLNHLILDKIFKNLSFVDLQTCRLVCCIWNDTVLKAKLNQTSEVYLDSLESLSLEQFIYNLKEAMKTDTTGFIPGFENYNLKINSELSTDTNMQIVWDQVGHKIRNLKLEVPTLYARNKLKEILLEETDLLQNIQIMVTKYWGPQANENVVKKKMPSQVVRPNSNLTSFSYTYLGAMSLYGFEHRGRDEKDYTFPVCWNDFFTRFPNLQKLSLVGLFEIELTEMLSVLQTLHKNNQKVLPNLRILEILDENVYPEAPNNDHLQILIELNPSLTELHLEISPALRTTLFNTVLTTVSPTLKVLRLRRFPQSYNFYERISLKVPMVGVTFLEISDRLVPSLAFLHFFPNLETLHVILRDYRKLQSCDIIENTSTSIEPHSNLKNIFIEPPLISESCVTKLLGLVPNLASLKIRMSNEMLWTVCGSSTACNGLRDLHIVSWGGLTDEGFTGIPQSVFQDGNFKGAEDVETCRIYPYIGGLRNLQTLTVEMWSDYSNIITDASVVYGLVDLTSVKEFRLIRTSITTSALGLMNFASCTVES